MKMLLLLSSYVLLSSQVFAANIQGQDKGNGGFLYSRTSKKLLDESQSSLQTELKALLKNRAELVYTSSQCSKPIDLKVLSKMVDNVTYDYQGKSAAINPDGVQEERFFQINNDGKVEALELFFSSFVDTYFRYNQENDSVKELVIQPIRTAIVHEALHTFQYDELEARKCSDDLIKTIESYNASKLKDFQDSVNVFNTQLIKEALIEKQCLTEKSFSNIKAMESAGSAASIPGYHQMLGRKILACLVKNLGGALVKESKTMTNELALSVLSTSLYEARKIDDVAKTLNELIKFSFEKEIPGKI